MYSSETQSLCQKLEQRIESLSKLGDHLQAENKGQFIENRIETRWSSAGRK